MRIIKGVFKGLILVILVLAVIGFFLPASTHVERTVTINTTAEKLFPYINNFEQFNRWSPWYGIDENTQYQFAGPATGKGAKMSWVSEHPQVGSGRQEIIESEPNSHVKTSLDFGAQGQAVATFEITESGAASNMTWALDSEWGYNLMGRYMGVLMMDKWVGEKYEEGLAKLKSLAESE